MSQSQSLPAQLPNGSFVAEKLDGAQFQIETLRGQSSRSGAAAGAESCACAAMDQMLQAIQALLHGFNQQLPEPLPPSRVSLRNLRDEFHSVQTESKALRAIEQLDRGGEWLDDLQHKHLASAFSPVLQREGDRVKLLKNPLDPEAGAETASASDFLQERLQRTRELIAQVTADIDDDVMRFREAHRQQTRRLI